VECSGCGNKEAYKTASMFTENEQGERVNTEWCDRCGTVSNVWMPDVFWDGKPEENLADGADGKPRVFGSKRDKAIYLKSKGIFEAGDSYHGAMMSATRVPARDTRKSLEQTREAIRKAKSMGADVRRREIHRMMKAQEAAFHA